MACEGATDRICRGVVTGETCIYPKAITNNLAPLEDIVFMGDGDAIALMWNITTSYAGHMVRAHIRPITQVGYSPQDIEVVDRATGIILFTGLDLNTRYGLWIRVEDADESNDWHYGTAYPVATQYPIPIYGVTYKGDLIVHQGDDIQHTQ